MSRRYVIVWVDGRGTPQYPGCTREEATCRTRREAESAIRSLRRDPDWADADLRIEVEHTGAQP